MKPTRGRTTDPGARVPVALALGSNLGESGLQLMRALARVGELLDDLRIAPLFRSKPETRAGQPDYLNTTAVGSCRIPAEDLLAALKRLEYLSGRRRGRRHDPRTLDIDLLLYGETTSDRPELRLPHPRLRQRDFVLVPLAEIAADWRVPPDGATVAELLGRLTDPPDLESVDWPPGRP